MLMMTTEATPRLATQVPAQISWYGVKVLLHSLHKKVKKKTTTQVEIFFRALIFYLYFCPKSPAGAFVTQPLELVAVIQDNVCDSTDSLCQRHP